MHQKAWVQRITRTLLTRRTHASQALDQGVVLKQFAVGQRSLECPNKNARLANRAPWEIFRGELGMLDAMFVTNILADKMQTVAFFLIAAMTQDDAEHAQGYEGAEHDHGGLY